MLQFLLDTDHLTLYQNRRRCLDERLDRVDAQPWRLCSHPWIGVGRLVCLSQSGTPFPNGLRWTVRVCSVCVFQRNAIH